MSGTRRQPPSDTAFITGQSRMAAVMGASWKQRSHSECLIDLARVFPSSGVFPLCLSACRSHVTRLLDVMIREEDG